MGFIKDVCWTESDTRMRHLFFRACIRGDAREAMALVAECPRLARDANDDLAEFYNLGRSGLAEAALAGHFKLAEELHPHSGKGGDATDNTSGSVNLAIALCLADNWSGLRWLEDFSCRTGISDIGASIGTFYRWREIGSRDPSATEVFLALRLAFDNDQKRIFSALRLLPSACLAKALAASIGASIPHENEDPAPEHAAGRLSCASVVLDMGASPSGDGKDTAPILCALYLGDRDDEDEVIPALNLLLARGADPLALDRHGQSWAEVARLFELRSAFSLLTSAAEKAALSSSIPHAGSQAKPRSL